MAPPRKPSNVKAISGTLRKDRPDPSPDKPKHGPPRGSAREIDMELVTATDPPHPPWLPNAHAVKEWRRLAPLLVEAKLLTIGALSPLAMLCAVHGKIVQLYAAGEAPSSVMLSTYRSLINDFGLTPASQGKVKVIGQYQAAPTSGGGAGGEASTPANPFARNGNRAA